MEARRRGLYARAAHDRLPKMGSSVAGDSLSGSDVGHRRGFSLSPVADVSATLVDIEDKSIGHEAFVLTVKDARHVIPDYDSSTEEETPSQLLGNPLSIPMLVPYDELLFDEKINLWNGINPFDGTKIPSSPVVEDLSSITVKSEESG
jgi:hypothetical protein